jgi:molybdate transport system ATP-binding protein
MSIDINFTLHYPGFTLNADFVIPSSGVTAIFGTSGSGKTTLLRAIAGLESIPGATVLFDDDVWQNNKTFVPTWKRPLGYVFQEASLFPHLSVIKNLNFALKRSQKNPPASIFSSSNLSIQMPDIIDLLGIGHLLQRKPDTLSGGERQRVAIARALLTQPRVLMMDEPLASLDHARKQEILPYLETLHNTLKIPILYVSHSPEEVARLADHLVVLEKGQVLASGPLCDTLSRVDLPVKLSDEPSVIIKGHVSLMDPEWNLALVDFIDGTFWVRDTGLSIGQSVRLRILARDVSLSLSANPDASFLNSLQAVVCDIGEDAHPALCLTRLRVGKTQLLSRLSRRSAHALQLSHNHKIWVQIKAVAAI